MIIIAVILMFVPLYGTCFMSWATFKIFLFIKSLINLIIMYYFGIISSCFLCIVSQFTHMHEADRTLLNTQEKPSAYLWSSLCRQRSASWCSVLWILASLVSLNSQLCLLNSGRSLGSAPFMWSGNLSGLWYSSPSCFPSLSDHCPQLLMFQVLKTFVSYIL